MMEGALSLMQMAKVSAALARLDRARLPFISVLTDPTTGGVTASFAMLGDLNIAEPKALIGFAGPRVIEQTIRQKLPEGFQRSEFLLEHGMLDLVVDRRDMKAIVARALRFMGAEPAPAEPAAGRRSAPRAGTQRTLTRCDLLDRLFALETFGIKLGLDNITRLCDGARPSRAQLHHAARRRHQRQGLGHGDGRMRRCVAAGIRTGALHLAAPASTSTERFVIGDGPVDDGRRSRPSATDVLDLRRSPARRRHAAACTPTFFEATTAIAFELFRRAGVEVAVIEVGLGGRFDATNVIAPVAGAITTIAFDHQQHLGHTLAQIAFEKAGIIKPGMTVVAGRIAAGCHAGHPQREPSIAGRRSRDGGDCDAAWKCRMARARHGGDAAGRLRPAARWPCAASTRRQRASSPSVCSRRRRRRASRSIARAIDARARRRASGRRGWN